MIIYINIDYHVFLYRLLQSLMVKTLLLMKVNLNTLGGVNYMLKQDKKLINHTLKLKDAIYLKKC